MKGSILRVPYVKYYWLSVQHMATTCIRYCVVGGSFKIYSIATIGSFVQLLLIYQISLKTIKRHRKHSFRTARRKLGEPCLFHCSLIDYFRFFFFIIVRTSPPPITMTTPFYLLPPGVDKKVPLISATDLSFIS